MKTVIQAIPSYVMSVFILPKGLCDDLEKMMNSFWWGKRQDGSCNIRWQRWEKLCYKKQDGGLGFRSVYDFNLAMLAKQAWRFITNPSSLCSRLFKAKYFPKSNFFEAELGHNPSYAWRSILSSKSVILGGARRRIGNGKDTKIWGSPWLLDDSLPCVQSQMPSDVEEVTVDALFIPGQLQWDVELVKSLFNNRDSNEILAIPLPKSDRCDKWRWIWNSKGMYTVKSGYQYLRSFSQQVMGPSITNWKFVWGLQVPPKIRNFIWRALSDNLPTKVALIARSMDVDPLCGYCNVAEETSIHALVLCPVVKQVWISSELGLRVQSADSMVQWWNAMKRVSSTSEMEYAAALLWSNWQNRNALVWEGSSKPASTVLYRAGSAVADWQSVRAVPSAAVCSNAAAQRRWVKPNSGFVKCNVDASVFRDPAGMSFGGIVRGTNGEFIAAIQDAFVGNFPPLIAEAVGLREVLSWIKERGFASVIIESDSKLLVDAIRSDGEDFTYFGTLVDDCKALLRAISRCSIHFVFRSANCVADSLAKTANSMTGRAEWDLLCPPVIADVMMADLI